MKTCHGVIIVAYERKFLDAGIEKRGGDAQQKIAKRTYTTPWNHIESAIAYTLGLPLYILCQKGLAEEGLIESKLDWYVQHLDISLEGLRKAEVTESLRTWVTARTVPQSQKRLRSLQALQGGLKLAEMTPKEYIAVGGILSATFALGAAAARLFPKLFNWRQDLVRSY